MSDRTPHFGHTKLGHAVHARTIDHLPSSTAVARFNSRLGVAVTSAVGSMWCAYTFALLALLSLPAVLTQAGFVPKTFFPHWLIAAGLIALVAWIAQTFLQLVLLSIIIVGTNVQSLAADARAAKTFEDTETIVDRLDEHTAGGIKSVLDFLKIMDTTLTAYSPVLAEVKHDTLLLHEIHEHVTALAPAAGEFPPDAEPGAAGGPVSGGAGSNPAKSEGVPAETASAGPVVPPPAAARTTGRRSAQPK